MGAHNLKFASIVALVPFFATLLAPSCSGQTTPKAHPGKSSAPVFWGTTNEKGYNNPGEVRLREPTELQDLPKFSGHCQFWSGQMREAENGVGYFMSFRAEERPDQVLDWYKQVLQMNKWTVKHTAPGILMSSKDGNRCTVAVSPTIDKKFKTSFNINYFLQKNNR